MTVLVHARSGARLASFTPSSIGVTHVRPHRGFDPAC